MRRDRGGDFVQCWKREMRLRGVRGMVGCRKGVAVDDAIPRGPVDHDERDVVYGGQVRE